MMAAQLKPFVPPIVWDGIKRALRGPEDVRTMPAGQKSIPVELSADAFTVSFERTTSPRGTFFVPAYAATRPASQAILAGTLYEPATHAVVAEILKRRGGSIIHAGTFFGDMLPSFSRACHGKVYAFEPVLENYILASLCVQHNDLSNVVLLNAALGTDVATARIDTMGNSEAHRGGESKISERGQLTAMMTIDALGICDLAIIQLDVEGHELHALWGAERTIKLNRPIIMVEDNQNNCAGLLGALGYSLRGKIPGLSIWTTADDAALVDGVLRRL